MSRMVRLIFGYSLTARVLLSILGCGRVVFDLRPLRWARCFAGAWDGLWTSGAYLVVARKITITHTSRSYYHVNCGCRMWSPVSMGQRCTFAVKCYWHLQKRSCKMNSITLTWPITTDIIA